MEINLKKILVVVILLFLAAVSFFLVAKQVSTPESNRAIITAIDEKAETVLKLAATSTVASAGLSAIPDDTATPIAEKLTDFTEYFLLILCVLYTEKYLLTIVGAAAFKILIPVACLCGIIALFWKPEIMKRLAVKLCCFGLALFVTIPLSIHVSDVIYENYRASIDDTIAVSEEFSQETSALSEAKGDQGLITSILNGLTETVTGLVDRAAKLLNNYVESLAVMIVTSCVIPLLVLVFFLWLIRLLTGIDISAAIPTPRKARKYHIPTE